MQQAKIRDKKTHTQTQCGTFLCVMAIANKHIPLIGSNIFLSLAWLIGHTTDIVDLLEKSSGLWKSVRAHKYENALKYLSSAMALAPIALLSVAYSFYHWCHFHGKIQFSSEKSKRTFNVK